MKEQNQVDDEAAWLAAYGDAQRAEQAAHAAFLKDPDTRRQQKLEVAHGAFIAVLLFLAPAGAMHLLHPAMTASAGMVCGVIAAVVWFAGRYALGLGIVPNVAAQKAAIVGASARASARIRLGISKVEVVGGKKA